MTTHFLTGLTLNFDTSGDTILSIDPTIRLMLRVPDDVTTFSYSVFDRFEDGLPGVEIDTGGPALIALNDTTISGIERESPFVNFDNQFEVETSLGQINWGAGQQTQVLAISVDEFFSEGSLIDGPRPTHFFILGGDPLPALGSAESARAFAESITSFEEIPSGTPLSPETDISILSIPGVTSREDSEILGTTDDDELSGTGGNDVLSPLSNNSEDEIAASGGSDIINLSNVEFGTRDFYTIDYSGLNTAITVDTDYQTNISRVTKGTNGDQDILLDAHVAMNWNFGDGIWITGTRSDDTFNIKNAPNSTWTGISAGAGDDTFNIESGTIVRLSYHGGATAGIDVDLQSGIVSNDGHGGADRINLTSNDTRIEIEGTAFADVILGSDLDERYILREGNDTLDAGGGADLLRYNRSGVDAVDIDLAEGVITGTWNGASFEHQVSNVERVFGSRESNDIIIGNDTANDLRAFIGNDVLAGGGGKDTVSGGDNDDTLYGDSIEAQYNMSEANQVYRLYQATLNRAPDKAGQEDWVSRIVQDGTALGDVAAGFVGSREFQNTYGALEDTDFVQLLYQNVLGREGDTDGLNSWLDALSGGASRTDVVLGFSESREFQNTTRTEATNFALNSAEANWTDDVYRMYQATLNRAPDLGGFENWVSNLANGADLSDVISGFVTSREFQNTYGMLDDEEFVQLLYKNVLGREGDSAGVAGWLDVLEAGGPRAEVVRGFSQSEEFINSTAEDVAQWVRTQGEDDYLVGGTGINTLVGGMMSDRFSFRTFEPSSNVIEDFEAWDTLEFWNFGYFSADQIRDLFTQQGADAVFTDQNVSVTLKDTQVTDLSDDVFSFF